MTDISQIRRWPYGFLDEYWYGYDDTDNPADLNSPDLTNEKELIGSIEYVLSVCPLKDREIEILRMRFQKRMIYADIAKELNLSGSRVRSSCERSMRKLRDKSLYKGILSKGVAAYARQRYEMRMNEEINKLVEERVAEIRQAEREQKTIITPEQRPKAKKQLIDRLARSTKISDLDLSTRSYHGLRRSSCYTVADILKLENRQVLLKQRSIGEKSVDEILNVLEAKGFNVSHLR